jgi:preprotein translocase subunit SecA
VAEDEIKPLMGTPALAAELVMKRVEEAYEMKCAGADQETLPYMERGVFLQVIDREWQDYLRAMDDLRHGVNLRAYGQRDPLIEYKKEAFDMFESLMSSIKSKVVSSEFRSATAARMQAMFKMMAERQEMAKDNEQEISIDGPREMAAEGSKPVGVETVADVFASMMSATRSACKVQNAATVGRNDPCPCGSGKKFKKCCGREMI